MKVYLCRLCLGRKHIEYDDEAGWQPCPLCAARSLPNGAGMHHPTNQAVVEGIVVRREDPWQTTATALSTASSS